ncbi:MAG: hypothetical protein Q3Y17_22385, partial [Blautia sp.]|nr:hypothetical protein [Blautia sp.]
GFIQGCAVFATIDIYVHRTAFINFKCCTNPFKYTQKSKCENSAGDIKAAGCYTGIAKRFHTITETIRTGRKKR